MDLQPLACSFDDETRTLYVSGSVDELSAPAFRDTLARHTADYRKSLTVDLGGVDFLPSVGVGVLAVAMRNAEVNGAQIELTVEPGSLPQQVLNVCGMRYRER